MLIWVVLVVPLLVGTRWGIERPLKGHCEQKVQQMRAISVSLDYGIQQCKISKGGKPGYLLGITHGRSCIHPTAMLFLGLLPAFHCPAGEVEGKSGARA